MHQSSTSCPRGVYVATFTESSGYRWVYSVDDKGVRIGLRCVPPGADFTPYLDELWAELERDYPMPGASSSASSPDLRLIA